MLSHPNSFLTLSNPSRRRPPFPSFVRPLRPPSRPSLVPSPFPLCVRLPPSVRPPLRPRTFASPRRPTYFPCNRLLCASLLALTGPGPLPLSPSLPCTRCKASECRRCDRRRAEAARAGREGGRFWVAAARPLLFLAHLAGLSSSCPPPPTLSPSPSISPRSTPTVNASSTSQSQPPSRVPPSSSSSPSPGPSVVPVSQPASPPPRPSPERPRPAGRLAPSVAPAASRPSDPLRHAHRPSPLLAPDLLPFFLLTFASKDALGEGASRTEGASVSWAGQAGELGPPAERPPDSASPCARRQTLTRFPPFPPSCPPSYSPSPIWLSASRLALAVARRSPWLAPPRSARLPPSRSNPQPALLSLPPLPRQSPSSRPPPLQLPASPPAL